MECVPLFCQLLEHTKANRTQIKVQSILLQTTHKSTVSVLKTGVAVIILQYYHSAAWLTHGT